MQQRNKIKDADFERSLMYHVQARIIFRNYFYLFALLNCLFLGLQLVFFWIFSFNFVHVIPMPKFVYLVIIGEGLLQVILYLLLTIVQLGWLWGIANTKLNRKITAKPHNLKLWVLIIFINSTILILTINCYFFPLSQFSRVLLFTGTELIRILLILSSIFLAGLTLNTIRCINFKQSTWMIICASLASFALIAYHNNTEIIFPAHKNPNIIIIGIDSLSPDYLNQQNTPTLNNFLQESTNFTETISPLARTYPAWVSILTGLYPLHHHARENLIPMQLVKTEASIVWRLRELGYYTLFATDDRRFSNLDREFGFQKIIGPKIGVSEMLLGNFYDFPLSNLLINSKISGWLFPYNHLNRASNYVYYPETFNSTIEHAINENVPSKPLLLAVHFTLPHWPYSWATSSPAQANNNQFDMKSDKTDLYIVALKSVDQQVATLMTHLAHHHLLDNSLVIVLSDHGETLYQKGSRITALKNYQDTKPSPLASYFKHKTSTSLSRSSGHGSDLLSPTQFHCVLGMKILHHGKQITTSQNINTRVALIDIAPTIYDFLHLPAMHEKRHFDGISLLPTILGKTTALIERTFMLESGLLPNQFMTNQTTSFYARLLYHVNVDNNLLELRPDKLNEVNRMKLYGILEKNWLLVLYPNDSHYLMALVQLNNRRWTDQPSSTFAKNSPFNKLLKKLREFYKIELKDYPAISMRS